MFLRQEYDINFLIKAEIVIPQNDVQAIDEALKQIHVGGIALVYNKEWKKEKKK